LKAYTKGFTLIELLVVICIIAILAGIIMPLYSNFLKKAKVVKALAGAKGLETAFKSYLDIYRVWPSGWADGDIEGNIFETLRGDNPQGNNPQGIAFYEFVNYTDHPGMDQTTAWDPWSNPDDPIRGPWRAYQVMFDDNYDNKINVNGQDVYRSVVVYSFGANSEDDQGDGDDDTSWK